MANPSIPGHAAQSPSEIRAFIEAFARVNVRFLKASLGSPKVEVHLLEEAINPDWDDQPKLQASGLHAAQIDQGARNGFKYLHIDVAVASGGRGARQLFLAFTGLSEKQRKAIFPRLAASRTPDFSAATNEVVKLNAWLDEVREGGFDPSAFVTYQRSLGLHGQSQNLSGQIGATGAAIAFIDALEELAPGSIIDSVGELPPKVHRSPLDLWQWQTAGPNRTVRALLLKNGRAVVFATSKDANIFQPLGNAFTTASEALVRFTEVANDEKARKQTLHEFAVGEVKTATDPANLHERMGLASRETQTELRTDRFLMMAILNEAILAGGVQRRVMNNRDLTRFSHVFNLHHCWGWDGGRARNEAHWRYFREAVQEWCGL